MGNTRSLQSARWTDWRVLGSFRLQQEMLVRKRGDLVLSNNVGSTHSGWLWLSVIHKRERSLPSEVFWGPTALLQASDWVFWHIIMFYYQGLIYTFFEYSTNSSTSTSVSGHRAVNVLTVFSRPWRTETYRTFQIRQVRLPKSPRSVRVLLWLSLRSPR